MKTTYSVGEIASILGISAQTIRKYEQKGIIRPTREDNNYRSFEAPDITMLFRIRLWRNMGFSFGEIQELVSRNRSRSVTELYEKQMEHLQQEIDRLQMMVRCAEKHQALYQAQTEPDGQIRIEDTGELYCLFYRKNRIILKEYLHDKVLKTTLEYSPPFRYIIELPDPREDIQKGDYRVGLAAFRNEIEAFPEIDRLTHIPACRCATVMIQHKVAKVKGKWENVSMKQELENSGIYRFIDENGFRTKGNIFGLTYYDEIDDRYFYHNIKYHFPIEKI